LHRECTRILGVDAYRVETIEWETDGPRTRLRVWIERRGIRGYECSGCGRRRWCVRDTVERTWDELPWAAHSVTLAYRQRRVWCRGCGIRTERVAFADTKTRVTRRLRQVIGIDCQSIPTSHAAIRHRVTVGDRCHTRQATHSMACRSEYDGGDESLGRRSCLVRLACRSSSLSL
jgi:transposase